MNFDQLKRKASELLSNQSIRISFLTTLIICALIQYLPSIIFYRKNNAENILFSIIFIILEILVMPFGYAAYSHGTDIIESNSKNRKDYLIEIRDHFTDLLAVYFLAFIITVCPVFCILTPIFLGLLFNSFESIILLMIPFTVFSIVVIIYIILRLSVFPYLFKLGDHNTISLLKRSWALTKNETGTLFSIALKSLIFPIIFAIFIGVIQIYLPSYFSTILGIIYTTMINYFFMPHFYLHMILYYQYLIKYKTTEY